MSFVQVVINLNVTTGYFGLNSHCFKYVFGSLDTTLDSKPKTH